MGAAIAGVVGILAGAALAECAATPPASLPGAPQEDQALQQLRGVKRLRHFLDKTDSEIAARIATEARLRAQVDATAPARRVVVQRNLTDWDFLVQLARRNDFRVWVDEREGVLHFRKPQGGDPGPVTFGVLQEE